MSIILSTALVVCVAAAPAARGAVEGRVRSKDKVLGTILPGSETERWTIACAEGSKLKVILNGPKKKTGGAVSFRVYDPALDEILGLDIKPKKTGAKLSRYDVPASGDYTVEVFATDGETGGDYKLKIICTPPKKLAFEGTLDGTEQMFDFFTVLGTQVTAKLKPAADSEAGPVLVRIDGPDDYEEPINVGPPKGVASPKIVLQRTGDFDLVYDGDGGLVEGSLKIKPKKSVARTIDVRSDTIDPGGDGGEQAVVGVVGPEGGSVLAPPGDGSNPSDIGGTGVDIPPGALDGAVAIVIATAPPIGPQENDEDAAGNTAFFGPEGLEFSEDATLTLPFDPLLVETEDDVRVYTRDAHGNITLIDPDLYDVDLVAGTVTVPTAHFSSFRVFRTREPLTVEDVVTSIPGPPADVISYRGFGQSIGKSVPDGGLAGIVTPLGEQYAVAHGEVVDLVVVNPFGDPPEITRIAGGGEGIDPTGPALDFDFPGPITALATDGFGLFVSTATQVFALFPDFEEGFDIQLIAGRGPPGDSGDGGDPLAATFTSIVDLFHAPSRGQQLFVLDRGAARLRLIEFVFDDESLTVRTVLGTGTPGVGPDGVAPEESPLLDPTAMCIGPEFGELFIADGGRIRLVQVIEDDGELDQRLHGGEGIQNHTFAGPLDGTPGPGTDGVSRQNAQFQDVAGLAFDFVGGRLVVSDRATHTVQEVPIVPGGVVRSLVGTRGLGVAATGDFQAPGTLLSPGACAIDFVNLVFLEEGTNSLRCTTLPNILRGPSETEQ